MHGPCPESRKPDDSLPREHHKMVRCDECEALVRVVHNAETPVSGELISWKRNDRIREAGSHQERKHKMG